MSIQNHIITSGAIFGSLYLVGTSLNNLNNILNYSDLYFSEIKKNHLSGLIIVNSFTFFLSGFTFFYFTYNAIK